MLSFLIVLMGALPEPRYLVEGVTLTQGEALWLTEARITYERTQRERISAVGVRLTEVGAEIVELKADRDATKDQGEKDAITAQITKIEDGTTERGKVAVRKVYAAARPSAGDARKITLSAAYDYAGDALRGDADNGGFLTRAETGWPAFVFNAVDANSNGELTAAELRAYWDGL